MSEEFQNCPSCRQWFLKKELTIKTATASVGKSVVWILMTDDCFPEKVLGVHQLPAPIGDEER